MKSPAPAPGPLLCMIKHCPHPATLQVHDPRYKEDYALCQAHADSGGGQQSPLSPDYQVPPGFRPAYLPSEN